jgi:hypothetical protein
MWLECHDWTALKKICRPGSILVQAEYCTINGEMYSTLKNKKKCGKKLEMMKKKRKGRRQERNRGMKYRGKRVKN